MKAKEIRGMDRQSLKEKALELKKELVKINAQIAIGSSIKSPGQVGKIKKTLARISAIEHEKFNKKRTEVGKKE